MDIIAHTQGANNTYINSTQIDIKQQQPSEILQELGKTIGLNIKTDSSKFIRNNHKINNNNNNKKTENKNVNSINNITNNNDICRRCR